MRQENGGESQEDGGALLGAGGAELSRSGSTAAPDIRCFNVKFSPNLGDGLLSECLESALIDLGASPATHSIDLAARKAYGEEMAGRAAVMAVLDALPKPARGALIRAPLAYKAAKSWRPHYKTGLRGADAVVIGGGNLISDLDLNFPTKLTLAIEEAEAIGAPIALYACGMATGWSKTGLRMCRKIFSSPMLKAVFVRDADSAALWEELMAPHTGHSAQVVRDPGLMACELYPAAPRAPQPRPVAGLGIMSHIAIRYHADNAPDSSHLDQWYVGVAKGLIEKGFQVRAFTNGSPEDKQYAEQLKPALEAIGSAEDITFITQRDPEGLCANIADFDVMIAYRMHAVIAAYSYGVPAIALAWDRKLQSFMRSVDREAWFRDVARTTAAECVDLAAEAAKQRLPEAARARVVAEARADVAKVWSSLFGEG
ncbi:MAG: polysaccharide pyruvyl transferase family protein [Pseudomonadota bacterium]